MVAINLKHMHFAQFNENVGIPRSLKEGLKYQGLQNAFVIYYQAVEIKS